MRNVIIVGAGLSGLAAGITLAGGGVGAEIFDLAPSAGGLCRAWVRKGYRFDSCIQWMAGTRKYDPAFNMLREVGALADDTEIFYPQSFSVEFNNSVYEVPMELGGFQGFMTNLSMEDGPAIDGMCADIETLMCAKSAPKTKASVTGAVSRLRSGRGCETLWRRTAGITVCEYAARFKSVAIGEILKRLAPEAYSAYTLLSLLSTRMSGNAGYPMGGAAGVIARMTEKFEALGGKLHCGKKADEIIINAGEARGIRTAGAAYSADGVIAAGSAPQMLDMLLGRRFQHPQLHRLLNNAPIYEPIAIISFGLCRKFDIPYTLTCACPEGIVVAPDVMRYGFALRSFDFDSTAAPAGGSSVVVTLNAPLDYWKKLRETNPASYRLHKELLADHVASKIEMRYPGFRDAIVVVDVATPATFDRLTNAYKGSLEGFAPTPEVIKTPVKKTIPGLKRFCLCGQWTSSGGGISAAVAGGLEAAQIIKREI